MGCDFDQCLTARSPGWAQTNLDAAACTEVEASRSGVGLHVWGNGELPHGRRITVGGGSVELYGTGRYIAVTGRMPQRLGDLQEVIDALVSAIEPTTNRTRIERESTPIAHTINRPTNRITARHSDLSPRDSPGTSRARAPLHSI